MTRFLLATGSVHAAAAACDYLEGRLTPADHVTVLAVRPPGVDPRDGGDALNVATVRLSGLASVETVALEGEPAATILNRAAGDVDEVVIGRPGAAAGPETAPGETVRQVVAGATVPVAVVPGPGESSRDPATEG